MKVAMSEAAWLSYVMDAAALGGWDAMHITDSRRAVNRSGTVSLIGDRLTTGWPDLTLSRPGTGIVFAELKTDKGRITPSQSRRLDLLAAAAEARTVRVGLWRPGAVSDIEAVLLGHDLEGGPWWPHAT